MIRKRGLREQAFAADLPTDIGACRFFDGGAIGALAVCLAPDITRARDRPEAQECGVGHLCG